MSTYPFQNLVFKGGGVKGIAYVGALQALEDAQIMSQINGFAGTSAGSIVSALAACRISAKDLNGFLSKTDYEKFKDKGGFFNYLKDLTENFGAYKGDYFLNSWFKTFLKQQNIDSEITFAGVNSKFGTDLRVFSTDLNTQTIQEFSKDTTPNVQIAYAVRASMSIPLFFKAWQFPDSNPNDHIFVDGGVMYNYPIDAFDSFETNPDQTLGFFLTDLSGKPTPPNNLDFGFTNIETYIKSLFEALMNSQDLMIKKDIYEEKRTVKVDDLGISATDFDINPQQVSALYQSGYQATTSFLKGFV
jgi:NTE family protein